MELSKYVGLACVTESIVPEIDGMDSRVLHGLTGMCTESGEILDAFKKHFWYGKELDKVNILEEIGDLCWYMAILTDALDLNFAELVEKAIAHNDSQDERPLFSIVSEFNAICGGNLVTMTTAGVPHMVEPLFFLVDEMIIEMDGKWEEICEVNIAKLTARYGDKFDAHKALNRDLETEREILDTGLGG